MCPQTGRAKRYAQCGFVDMRGLKRVMRQQVRGMFCGFAKMASNGDTTKALKIVGNIRQKLHDIYFVKFGRSYLLMHFENVAKTWARSNILKRCTSVKSENVKIHLNS